MRDFLGEALRGPTVFKDESVLNFDYVPPALLGREPEQETIALAFRQLLKSATPQNVLLKGPVGTGKTVLANWFARHLEAKAREMGTTITWVDVNCRRHTTSPAALLKILTKFDPSFPDRGFSLTEMLEALRKFLRRRETHLVVILDEADVLLRKSGSDLVYNLTRFNEEDRGAAQTVSLILAGQTDASLWMDPATASTFKKSNAIGLKPYDAKGLKAIVAQRVELGFRPGTVPDAVQDLVADIAAETGDARFAIELLHKAGLAADHDGAGALKAEHVRAAKAQIQPFVTQEHLADLDKHKLLVLLGLCRVLGKGDAFAMTGEVEIAYHAACEEYGEKARGHTQFWTYVQELDHLGLIQAKRSGKGFQGTTTLMSLPDVPAKALEEKIVEMLEAA